MLGVAPVNIRVINLQVIPSVTPRSLRRLHWVMVQWPIGLDCDAWHRLGIIPGETYREPQAASVRWRVSSAIALELVSRKLQAPSSKLDR